MSQESRATNLFLIAPDPDTACSRGMKRFAKNFREEFFDFFYRFDDILEPVYDVPDHITFWNRYMTFQTTLHPNSGTRCDHSLDNVLSITYPILRPRIGIP